MTTAREQAREAAYATLGASPPLGAELISHECADAASDVWEEREARLRIAFNTLGYNDSSFDKFASGEKNPNRCESVVHHGPGHQSTSQCSMFVHDLHDEHHNNELGYYIEWTDEDPYA